MRLVAAPAIVALIMIGCGTPSAGVSVVPSGIHHGPTTAEGQFIAGRFNVVLDPLALSAVVTPPRLAQAQPPQAFQYDLDIANFLAADSFEVTGVSYDGAGDVVLDFIHRHPFPAPDLTQVPFGKNRADLGYTGRLLILATTRSVPFFNGAITTDPGLIRDADGYCHAGDLLHVFGMPNNTFPYVLLADDGEDNRIGVSNGGNPRGNFGDDPAGWQRSNLGANGTGWTGYDILHGGQGVRNRITFSREDLTAQPLEFEVAMLIKYTDPKGAPGRTLRLPPEIADPLQFAYRMPYGALDASRIAIPGILFLGAEAGASQPWGFPLRDWDAQASEAVDGDLSDETDVSLVQPGASGFPTAEVDASFLDPNPQSLTLFGPSSGIPGDELAMTGTLTNTLGVAAPGEYQGLIRVVDPEDALDDSAYHFGLDPQTVIPDAARALSARTYQVVRIVIGETPPDIPEIIEVQPGGTVGTSGQLVNFYATVLNNPTEWAWDFGGGGSPNTSTEASPSITLGAVGTYQGTLIASNAAGSSAPHPFSFTVAEAGPPTWHAYTVDANPGVGRYGSMVIYDGKPVIAYEDGVNFDLRVARALVENPASAAVWQIHIVDGLGDDNDVGQEGSLAVVDGFLAIAYHDDTNRDLKYARAQDPTPTTTTDWTFHRVDGADSEVGLTTSLTVVNGVPWISYFDASNGDLRVARGVSSLPDAEEDWITMVADVGGDVGLYTSIEDLAGVGAVSYYDRGVGALRFARALSTTPTGPADWSAHEVDRAGGPTGFWTSLAILAGNPAITYYNFDAQDLRISLATSATPGAGDWFAYTIDGSGRVGTDGSLIVQDGRLAVSYWAAGASALRVARADTELPTNPSAWDSVVADSPGVGQWTSLVDYTGVIAVSYYDVSQGHLKYAQASGPW